MRYFLFVFLGLCSALIDVHQHIVSLYVLQCVDLSILVFSPFDSNTDWEDRWIIHFTGMNWTVPLQYRPPDSVEYWTLDFLVSATTSRHLRGQLVPTLYFDKSLILLLPCSPVFIRFGQLLLPFPCLESVGSKKKKKKASLGSLEKDAGIHSTVLYILVYDLLITS